MAERPARNPRRARVIEKRVRPPTWCVSSSAARPSTASPPASSPTTTSSSTPGPAGPRDGPHAHVLGPRLGRRAQQLTIDFVVHGDVGVAGPWARTAQPGDELDLVGPGGAYTPDPDADWHLLAGDASVIPAISASLPRIPRARPCT